MTKHTSRLLTPVLALILLGGGCSSRQSVLIDAPGTDVSAAIEQLRRTRMPLSRGACYKNGEVKSFSPLVFVPTVERCVAEMHLSTKTKREPHLPVNIEFPDSQKLLTNEAMLKVMVDFVFQYHKKYGKTPPLFIFQSEKRIVEARAEGIIVYTALLKNNGVNPDELGKLLEKAAAGMHAKHQKQGANRI